MTFAELMDDLMCAIKWSFMNSEIIFTDGTKNGQAEEMVIKNIHRHWDEEGKTIVEIELENVTTMPEPILYDSGVDEEKEDTQTAAGQDESSAT